MRFDRVNYGGNSATVLGRTIAHDMSGQGHCWSTIHSDDFSAAVAEEIEAEIVDGGLDTCEDYLTTDGRHYAWGPRREDEKMDTKLERNWNLLNAGAVVLNDHPLTHAEAMSLWRGLDPDDEQDLTIRMIVTDCGPLPD